MTRRAANRLLAPSVAAALALALAAPAEAAEYEVDPGHSFVSFQISHIGISVLHGRFNTLGGRLVWDQNDPAGASIVIDVDPASIDTNHAERDKHLRDADFLDVETHGTAGFRSTAYQGDANGGKLTGELTVHGVTRPVEIDVVRIGEGPDPWGGYRVGFSGTTSIRRADFGMDYDLGPAGETMSFELVVEAIRR